LINRKKNGREDRQFHRKQVKVMLIFKNLTNNYIVKDKIGIMKCGN